uniref:Uncharacterized protein n=1 Tax=Lepeophtheirus salmonis TaxID=72036 RepID=A0A0K2UXN0_LEPSM
MSSNSSSAILGSILKNNSFRSSVACFLLSII